ncbi:hypothetical protein [Pedobacter faecalis]|uniref:hypothetical protein n=1 Tax=Pedobacter faecalis TaxID=3041495 RepID=UPI0025503147|nr:hypothetical protein [Pedobacter sp. ELA7]
MAACKSGHRDYSAFLRRNSGNAELKKIVDFYYTSHDFETKEMTEYLLNTLPYQYTIKYSLTKDAFTIPLDRPLSADSLEAVLINEKFALKADTSFFIDSISANVVIDNINFHRKLRRQYVWFSEIPIDKYCRYVLPDHINNEYVYNYKHFYRRRYLPRVKDILEKGSDTTETITSYLAPFFENIEKPQRSFVDFYSQPSEKILLESHFRHRDFEDISVIYTHALRSVGVPATYEYIPVLSPHSDGLTYVHTFSYNARSSAFDLNSKKYNFRIAKCYRNEFDVRLCTNPYREILKLGVRECDIPLSLNIPKSIDVTGERTVVTDISFNLPKNFEKDKILYLSAFGVNWRIISWAKVDDISNKITFTNIGVGLKYKIVRYKARLSTDVSKDFVVHSGNNEELKGILMTAYK